MVVVEGYCEVDRVVIFANCLGAGWDEDWKMTTCGVEWMSYRKVTSRFERSFIENKEVVIVGTISTRETRGVRSNVCEIRVKQEVGYGVGYGVGWGNVLGQGYRKKRRCQKGLMRKSSVSIHRQKGWVSNGFQYGK
jgi:hypothetical protein